MREIQEAMGRGQAVEGIRQTLRAVSDGQVRMLLVGERCAGPGIRCETSGRLVLPDEECKGEGNPMPLPDVVDEAVEDALRKGASVLTLPASASEELLDGIGAFLRYQVP
jgi:peptide subunit release factor 1 (eRF1)